MGGLIGLVTPPNILCAYTLLNCSSVPADAAKCMFTQKTCCCIRGHVHVQRAAGGEISGIVKKDNCHCGPSISASAN